MINVASTDQLMTNLYCRATVNLVIESAEENPLSGPNKSLKNSLRESFNKIRSDPSDLIFSQLWVFPRRSHTARVHQKKRLHYCDTQPLIIPEHDVPDSCLPERRVIAEDGSLVRSLHFSCTFIENTTSTSPTLWVGTNSGLILVLSLAIPELFEDRQSDGILAVLAKEIQLQHKAPVVGIEVLDAKGSNLTSNSEVSCQSLLAYNVLYDQTMLQQTIGSVPHKVLICSEEQFKLFSLPGLAACGKYKVTANEGVVVRRTKTTAFSSLAVRRFLSNEDNRRVQRKLQTIISRILICLKTVFFLFPTWEKSLPFRCPN